MRKLVLQSDGELITGLIKLPGMSASSPGEQGSFSKHKAAE